MAEIVNEMDYLRSREQKLRDTNESTNNRVKWFGFMTTFLLIGLWVWQVLYLRAYFRCVYPFSSRSVIFGWSNQDHANLLALQIQAPYLKGGHEALAGHGDCWGGGDVALYEDPGFTMTRAVGFRNKKLEHGFGTFSDTCTHRSGKAFNQS